MFRDAKVPFLLACCGLALAACGGVQVKPQAPLPKALVVPMPAKVGLVLGGELRSYRHEETRAATDWTVDLGEGNATLWETVTRASFTDAEVFASRDAAQAAPGLLAVFEPRIEQYSFATANDTAGGYWAVTIRYRINVLAPEGEEADSLTLTGYGSSLPEGGAGASLTRATASAMRDAASKFLVQLPRQPLAVALRQGQPVRPAQPGQAAVEEIETVPIDDAG